MFLPHAIHLLKQNIFLKVDAPICAPVSPPFSVKAIQIFPSSESLHGHILHLYEHPLISRDTLCGLLALRQDCFVFLMSQHPKEALHAVHSFIDIQRGGNLQAFKHSTSQVDNHVYHCSPLMIERINVRELTLDVVLLSLRKAFFLNNKYFCIFSFLIIITIFQFIGPDIWIKPKGFIPRRSLAQRLGY